MEMGLQGLKAADPEFPWIHEREWALRRGERSLAGFCLALNADALAANGREEFTGRGIEDGCNGRHALLNERH